MWTVLQVILLLCVFFICSVWGREPDFDVPVINVTITAGMTAVLPCSVNFLENYKRRHGGGRNVKRGSHQKALVIWTNPKATLLTLENTRIIDDDRISINRPYRKEWNLHIRDVNYGDQGEYTCQINTDPVKIKKVYLHVQVPAAILDHLSSQDVLAKEGDTVMLVCNVTGVPHPEVTWYRLPTHTGAKKERIGVSGEILIIHNVSRFCDDIYECVAYNGVPPAVNRPIRVTVQFPPEIQLPNRRIGQARGKDTILECIITAHPHRVNGWERNGQVITNDWKYRVEIYEEGDHTITLSLRIRSLDVGDFGEYTCVSDNPMGDDKETMYLYELVKSKPTTTSTVRTTHSKTTDPEVVTWSPKATKKVPDKTHKPGKDTDNRGGGYEPGKSGEKLESKGSLANKGAYACIFIVVFLSALTSICVWKRT